MIYVFSPQSFFKQQFEISAKEPLDYTWELDHNGNNTLRSADVMPSESHKGSVWTSVWSVWVWLPLKAKPTSRQAVKSLTEKLGRRRKTRRRCAKKETKDLKIRMLCTNFYYLYRTCFLSFMRKPTFTLIRSSLTLKSYLSLHCKLFSWLLMCAQVSNWKHKTQLTYTADCMLAIVRKPYCKPVFNVNKPILVFVQTSQQVVQYFFWF